MPDTTGRIAGETRALIMDPLDNVAVAIRELTAGETLVIVVPDGSERSVTTVEPIPFGHKFSTADIAKGDQVIKYGERIGRATQSIPTGSHTHSHNLTSQRGRGDLTDQRSGRQE
ncbi:MAG: UxaA family hydrolase [Thermomicrobia bacterium]|nr:UxaA family hydrolase [Thermomicrobia bacterium]